MRQPLQTERILGIVVAAILVHSVSGLAQQVGMWKGRKQIATWLVFNEEKGFERIRQNADILNSLSEVAYLSVHRTRRHSTSLLCQ